MWIAPDSDMNPFSLRGKKYLGICGGMVSGSNDRNSVIWTCFIDTPQIANDKNGQRYLYIASSMILSMVWMRQEPSAPIPTCWWVVCPLVESSTHVATVHRYLEHIDVVGVSSWGNVTIYIKYCVKSTLIDCLMKLCLKRINDCY